MMIMMTLIMKVHLVCNTSRIPPPNAAPITHQNLITWKEVASLSENVMENRLGEKDKSSQAWWKRNIRWRVGWNREKNREWVKQATKNWLGAIWLGRREEAHQNAPDLPPGGAFTRTLTLNCKTIRSKQTYMWGLPFFVCVCLFVCLFVCVFVRLMWDSPSCHRWDLQCEVEPPGKVKASICVAWQVDLEREGERLFHLLCHGGFLNLSYRGNFRPRTSAAGQGECGVLLVPHLGEDNIHTNLSELKSSKEIVDLLGKACKLD